MGDKPGLTSLPIGLAIALAILQAIAAIMAIADRLKPPWAYKIMLSLVATLVLVGCTLLLWWFLRKIDWRLSALILLVFSVGIAAGILLAGRAPSLSVTITEPHNKDVVVNRTIACGSVRGKNAKVWTIVHPMGTDGYWVQPLVTVNPDGTWDGTVLFGGRDTFELVAVVNPTKDLMPGQVLKDWPEAKARSQAVQVVK
jgi:hypothetical protein